MSEFVCQGCYYCMPIGERHTVDGMYFCAECSEALQETDDDEPALIQSIDDVKYLEAVYVL